jgi:peptide/nickel transport system permease protein
MADIIQTSKPLAVSKLQKNGARSRLARFMSFWGRRANWAINLSLVAVVLLILVVIFAGQLTPHTPTDINLRNRLAPPVFLEGGTWENPLGTDATGRDILSRTLYGGRVSLLIGAASTALGLAFGTLMGLVSGFLRGWLDEFIMYLVDVQLSLPFILLAIALALVLGSSIFVLIGLAALATWPVYTRVVRGAVLSIREREFVIAARALGANGPYIVLHHLLPNIIAPLLVLATLSVGRVILLESGLSFVGVGIKPPNPTWGNMINESRDYLASAWWLAMIPGIALMILTMAIGTIGDWMRDLSDTTLD